jgi:dihydropyrimidinase
LEPVDTIKDLVTAYDKRVCQAKDSVVDYQFHATIKNPKDNLEAFVIKVKELGLNSIKLFTTYSNSGRRTYDEDIYALLELSKKHNVLIMAHIEDDSQIDLNPDFPYQALPISRPSSSELKEAIKLANFAKITGGNLYMVHLSSGDTLSHLQKNFSDILGKNFHVESCPHYFVFNQDVYLQEDGYLYTMAPPLRSFKEQKRLISLFDIVEVIGTDHCAFYSNDKNHSLLNDMPLGIPGIEHSFDMMYHLFQEKAIDKMSKNVAQIHKLNQRKGCLEEKYDADIVIYNLDHSVVSHFHSTCDYSLYAGLPKSGTVESTLVRGKFVIKDGVFVGGKGTLIQRSDL